MGAYDKASETMSICPVCRMDAREKPDPNCKICEGAGLVTGDALREHHSQTRQRVKKG